MNYSSTYLRRQLASARKIGKGANARLEADPDDFMASLRARSMDNRVNLLKKYRQIAESKAKRSRGGVITAGETGICVRKTRQPRVLSGVAAPKYDNSDRCLDRIVRNKNGVLFVCNVSFLTGCV